MDKNLTQDIASSNHENGHILSDVTDLVNQIFQAISNNKKIPNTIRIELVKLQSSYLKIASKTPNLFRLKNHQARLFLDSTVNNTVKQNTGKGITEMFIKKIKSLVEQITKLEQYDSKLFIKLEKDLERFIKRQIKRAEVKKKRENEKQKGFEKITQAKQLAKQLLQDRISNKKLPKFVKLILIKEWYNVLVLFNLRHNSQSQNLQDNLGFVDMLVEYTHADSQMIVSKSQILSLSKKYKKGLELVAFNSTDIEAKSEELSNNINQLIKTRASLKERTTASNTDIIEPLDIIKLSTLKKQQGELNTKNFQKKSRPFKEPIKSKNIDYSELIDSLKKGDWFEISTEGNKFIKAKLSWISPISGKYLFVDLNGLKISDKTKLELQQSINDKTIKLLKNN